MAVSRVLHGISGRSAAELPHELTLPQLRALVVLDDDADRDGQGARRAPRDPAVDDHPPRRPARRQAAHRALAGWSEIGARSCSRSPPAGRRVVDQSMEFRRQAIREILESLTRAERASVLDAFAMFAAAGRASPTHSPSTRCDHARTLGRDRAGRPPRTRRPCTGRAMTHRVPHHHRSTTSPRSRSSTRATTGGTASTPKTPTAGW